MIEIRIEKSNIEKIKEIEIEDLFNQFNYHINITSESLPVTLLYGMNGSGKTTILRGIHAILKGEYSYFNTFPIKRFELVFKSFKAGIEKRNKKLYSIAHINNRKKEFEIKEPSRGSKRDYYRLIRNLKTHRLTPVRRRRLLNELKIRYDIEDDVDIIDINLESDTIILKSDTGKTTYHFSFDALYLDTSKEFPSWLNEIRRKMPSSYLIKEQRLIRPELRESREESLSSLEAVPFHERDLLRKISSTLNEYANQSQLLDQSFPTRIFKQQKDYDSQESLELSEELSKIDIRRKELQRVGVLEEEEEVDPSLVEFKKDFKDLDTSLKIVLSTYIEDNWKKLSIFDNLYARVLLFQKTVNNYFVGKKLYVNGDKGFSIIMDESEKELSTDRLSSGEKNMLVMVYELIFKTDENSMVLIDEPEISLHVKWQKKLIDDLADMGKLNDLTFILATHSPMIIADRWNLAVRLTNDENKS